MSITKGNCKRHNYTRNKPFLVQKPLPALHSLLTATDSGCPEPGTQSGPARWFGRKSLFSTFTTCRFGSWKGFGMCQLSEDVQVQHYPRCVAAPSGTHPTATGVPQHLLRCTQSSSLQRLFQQSNSSMQEHRPGLIQSPLSHVEEM